MAGAPCSRCHRPSGVQEAGDGSGEAPAVTSDVGFSFWKFLSFLACFALLEAASLPVAAALMVHAGLQMTAAALGNTEYERVRSDPTAALAQGTLTPLLPVKTKLSL